MRLSLTTWNINSVRLRINLVARFIKSARPDVLFVACCGFGVERTREDLRAVAAFPGWRELPAVRRGRVYLADGAQFFSRGGPRLVDSLEMLAHALDRLARFRPSQRADRNPEECAKRATDARANRCTTERAAEDAAAEERAGRR